MPRIRRKRNSRSPEWSGTSEYPVFMFPQISSAGQPKSKRTRSRRSTSTVIPKTTCESVILLDDSDDECLSTVLSRSKKINQNASDKVDNFFKSSGLLSDDEDEVFQGSSSTINKADTNKPGVSGVSTLESDASVIVLEDDPNEIVTVKEIQDYCKETEEIIKNAKAILEKFTDNKEPEEQKPQEKTPEKKIEQAPRTLGDCPICYESFTEKQVMTTKCGHLFCKICIEKVAVSVKKCPTCRKPVNKKNLIPIFI